MFLVHNWPIGLHHHARVNPVPGGTIELIQEFTNNLPEESRGRKKVVAQHTNLDNEVGTMRRDPGEKTWLLAKVKKGGLGVEEL